MAELSCATKLVEREPLWSSPTARSAMVSMVCHLLALILFGLMTVAVQRSDGGVDLFSQMISTADAPDDWAQLTTEASDGGASAAAGPEVLFTTDAFAAAELDGPKVDLPVAPQAAGLGGDGTGHAGGDHRLDHFSDRLA